MKNIFQSSLALLGSLLISFVSFAQDQCAPVGWATQNGGTTGGGAAAPITVSTLADLKTQASSSGAKVIYVSGTVGTGVSTRVSVAANKTIIGLPGATLYGGFDVKAGNIIIRNMIVHGPGSVDVNGVDCITIDGSSTTNIWIDHCDIYDGQDGNMDITNGANYIAVTWCKFHYTGASSNHQFCNLLGNSDSKTSDRGKLKITMMYNWWTAGCVERMPRVRFGQVHVVNNLFDSKQTSYCVRAGIEANILVESNYFDAVKNPIDLYQNNFTAVTEKNNFFNNTTGSKAGSGTAFTPPYSLSITAAANVKALVNNPTCGAGATMASPTSCGCGTTTTYTLSTTSNPSGGGTVTGAGTYNSGTVVTITATPAAGYTFTGWSGAASGTNASTTVTMNANKSVTATFAPITYTLTTTANPAAGGTVTGAGTYNSGTVVTVTATPAVGYTFTGWSGAASGTNASTTVTMSANRSVTANFAAAPNLLSIAFNNTATTFFLRPPYISAVISDPTDPARTKGIVVDVKDNGVAIPISEYTITGSSSSNTVVTNANISFTKSAGQANIKITPSTVGYTTITITLTKGPNSKTIAINYAASASAATPSQTIWPTGISDASAAIALDDDYFVAGDDELNNLYVHSRKESGLPLTSFNYAGNLALPDGVAEEVDLEAAVRSTTTTGRVYWIGSMGNGKAPNFNTKPNRNRIFATNISGTAAATSFSVVGYYGTLKENIIAWGDANGYNFTASAAAGHDAKVIDGFNVEGLTFGPDNSTLYIGMRAPLVPVANRTRAVIAPVLNFEVWFNNGSPSGNPTFGAPIELNLGGRGIRDLVRLSNGIYIIVAGSSDETQISALYKWTGNAADAPVALNSFNTAGINTESAMGVNEGGVLSLTKLQLVADNGSSIFYADAIEAKDLTQNNFKKYRSDILPGDLSSGTVMYTLATTASPAAGGTVTGAGTYTSGTVVTLTATPASGYSFTGWSGDASGSSTSTTVTMNSNKSVTANFQAISPTTYTLATTGNPAGGGTVTGAGTYNSGTIVTVTATAAADYTFTSWSGDASGTSTSATVTMNANKSVTANFSPITYTLTTTATPIAGGTVTKNPNTANYTTGTVVTLTATAASGYIFTGWSGDATGTNASTTVTMNSNKSVTANFQVSGGTNTTIRIEDNATTSTGLCLYEGTISSNSGADNGKVINLTNSAAKGINWKVIASSGGSYTLNWRYVNSSSSNTYVMKLIVNGITIDAALPFPKTSSSSVFANTTKVVTLGTGYNTIRLESTAANATADIDWIEITGNNPVPGDCNAARPAPVTNNTGMLTSSKISGIFPNPAKGKVSVGFYLPENDKVTIKVYDTHGRIVDNLGTRQFGRGDQQVAYNLTGKTAGYYNVVIIGEKGWKKVLKLIVE